MRQILPFDSTTMGSLQRTSRAPGSFFQPLLDGLRGTSPVDPEESPPPWKEIKEGRDLQLPIYVLAVENALLPEEEVVEGFYYSISAAKRSTLLSSTKKGEPNPEWQEMLDQSRQRVHDYVQRARTGLFPVLPTGDCPSYCDFADICRKKLTSERKKLPSESIDA